MFRVFATPPVREIFLYPILLGHFSYLPGYRLHRLQFNSFLLIYILEGTLTVEFEGSRYQADQNQFILLDCYKEHCYCTENGCEVNLIHFDGITARKMYEMITKKHGNLFSLSDPLVILNRMARIYQPFQKKEPIQEALISKYINDILTEFIICRPLQIHAIQHASAVENVCSYIQHHIQEDLLVADLARQALMSTYHFIRVFKRETGMSPHEYIVSYRIQIASILLKESNMSVNDICFESGFSSESVFCAAFKKRTGFTPTSYRKKKTD